MPHWGALATHWYLSSVYSLLVAGDQCMHRKTTRLCKYSLLHETSVNGTAVVVSNSLARRESLVNCPCKTCSNTHTNWGWWSLPLQPQCLYYAALIATCQVNNASPTQETLQLSAKQCKLWYAAIYHPPQLGWVWEQVLVHYTPFWGESGYARLSKSTCIVEKE